MKDYLGDSVYAETGDFPGEVILTTDNGDGPSNTIYLDPQVFQALVQFVARSQAADNYHEEN